MPFKVPPVAPLSQAKSKAPSPEAAPQGCRCLSTERFRDFCLPKEMGSGCPNKTSDVMTQFGCWRFGLHRILQTIQSPAKCGHGRIPCEGELASWVVGVPLNDPVVEAMACWVKRVDGRDFRHDFGPTVTVTAAVSVQPSALVITTHFQVSTRACRHGVGLTHSRRRTIQQPFGHSIKRSACINPSSNMDPPMHVAVSP